VNSVPFACHDTFRVQDSARLSCIRETKTNQNTIGERPIAIDQNLKHNNDHPPENFIRVRSLFRARST